jgi:RNAse (barnase) inhibitor barstar
MRGDKKRLKYLEQNNWINRIFGRNQEFSLTESGHSWSIRRPSELNFIIDPTFRSSLISSMLCVQTYCNTSEERIRVLQVSVTDHEYFLQIDEINLIQSAQIRKSPDIAPILVLLVKIERFRSHFGKLTICAMKCCTVQVQFDSVRRALAELNISTDPILRGKILVWSDSLIDDETFLALMPYQVISRILSGHVLCWKASLARSIRRISQYFPAEYGRYFPTTFILPLAHAQFLETLQKTQKRYPFKPDLRSLGLGIHIITPEHPLIPRGFGVAQEYVRSYLIDNTKFDLGVYALIASLNPFPLYVFRDGIARFCSQPADGPIMYSHLTNVSLNKKSIGDDFLQISRLISDVFPILASDGVDIEKLWDEIDEAISLTFRISHKHLAFSEHNFLRVSGYSPGFQIFGFDILLDRHAHPWVLEVNYRPLLDFHRAPERRMKTQIVREAIRIACPLEGSRR